MVLLRRTIGAAIVAAFAAAPAMAGSFDSASVSAPSPLSSYESVYVAPVGLALDLNVKPFDRSGSGDRPVDPEDAAAKAGDFHSDLVRAFGRSFAIADGPGAGILTVEATLTDLESSRPTRADYSQQVSLSASSVFAGGAAMTVVFSEAASTLGQVSDSYSGVLTDARARGGIWDDADRAFSRWADNLVDFVQSN